VALSGGRDLGCAAEDAGCRTDAEKIYEFLHEELPYSTTVETTDWKPFKNGSVRVEQTIYVERDSQKAIVLGKGGQTIKNISSKSRNELAKILEHDVHLSCL